MSEFNFEIWFENTIAIKNVEKKQYLKEWLQENDYETLEVLIFRSIELPKEKIWATLGVQTALDYAISRLRPNPGFVIIHSLLTNMIFIFYNYIIIILHFVNFIVLISTIFKNIIVANIVYVANYY